MIAEENKYAFLADVLDLMLDAVCVVDCDGRFVFVNAAFELIFGGGNCYVER